MSRPKSAQEAFEQYVSLKDSDTSVDFDEWVAAYPEFEHDLRLLRWHWTPAADTPREGEKTPSFFQRLYPDRPLVPENSPIHANRTIGDFRLLQCIAQGGMGQVWLAEQVSLARPVALKFIRPDRLSERSVVFFEREARAGGRLSHPGIVTTHATGETDGLRWIAQELVPGGSTLQHSLEETRRSGNLPAGYTEQILRLVILLTDALQAAHDMGVVHRDLKPENILITPDNRPRISDFGLARMLDEALGLGAGLEGTPQYMSPEQTRPGPLDQRSDIYSLGVILFEALTLKRPFRGEVQALLARIREAPAPDPRSIRPTIPREVAAITLKALRKDPAERFQSMREFGDELRRFLRFEVVQSSPTGVPRRLAKWTRRNPTIAAVTVLGVLLLVTGTILGTRMRAAVEASVAQKKSTILERARRKIGVGDLAGARAEVERLDELLPDDPDGRLLLAAGYARFFYFRHVKEELATLAERTDGGPALEDDDDPMAHFLRALQVHSQQGFAGHEAMAAELERALELDPHFEAPLFPLYFARRGMGDLEGAKEALRRHRNTLRVGHPHTTLVDALSAELEGDYESATTLLEDLHERVGDDAFGELRGFRALGRNRLFLERENPSAGHLAPARISLERAVEQFPEDSSSWANLGVAHLRESGNLSDPAEALRLAEEAEGCAERALEIDPSAYQARSLHAGAAVRKIALTSKLQGTTGTQPRDEAWRRIARLKDSDPEGAAAGIESDLLYFEGAALLAAGDDDGAYALFEESCQTSDQQLWARVLLAQSAYLLGDLPTARDRLEEALAIWEAGPSSLSKTGLRWERRWYFAILAWLMGTHDRMHDVETALVYLERARTEMDTGEPDVPDLFSFAEFVALSSYEEVRDCALVRRILDEYGVRERYAQSREAELLRKIEAACD